MHKVENIISFNKLLQRGVYIEKASEFEKSIFGEVFQNARYSVEKIVQMNHEKENIRYLKKHSGEIEIPNVISFIGRRGTGKTSALLSFQRALEEYGSQNSCGRQDTIRFDKEVDMENVRFFTLDFIDASILEKSEDVFILVLARMYKYLQDVNNTRQYEDTANAELVKKLEDIYTDFLNLKEEKQYKNDIYLPIERLEHIASSQNIREQFKVFVENYLFYVSSRSNPCRESYLIITIDDLDMANYNGSNKKNNKSYEISNSIHKYLSIPGVIVLTAYNHVNLIMQNWSFFIDGDQAEKAQSIREQRRVGTELTSQFMDKVFSLDYRIYMPSWRKPDFQKEKFLINVKTDCKDEENIFYQYFYMYKSDVLTIKEFILVLYAAKTGIYFDYRGKGIHFLEPDSLRKLVSIVKLFELPGQKLEKMVSIEEKSEYRSIIFKKIKNEAYFRFAQENLFFPEEREFFDELMTLRIDKRSEEIVRKYCRFFSKLGKKKKKLEDEIGPILPYDDFEKFYFEEELKQKARLSRRFDNSYVAYSFAELVHTLYHMLSGVDWVSREMASCILFSYSVGLSDIYDDYRKRMHEVDKEEMKSIYRKTDSMINWTKKLDDFNELNDDYEILKGVIGKSICGHWTEYFFPEVFPTVTGMERRQNTLVFGCVDVSRIEFAISGIKNKESDIIKQIIVYALLYMDVLDWDKVQLELQLGDEGNYAVKISDEKTHELELTSYINFAFLYRDFLAKMEKLLLNAIDEKNSELKAKIIGKDANSDEMVSERLIEQLELLKLLEEAVTIEFDDLWNDFIDWDKKYGAMIIPIHNFDLIYNMIVNMYLENIPRIDAKAILSGEDFWNEFDKMNEKILWYLKDIDKFYGREKEDRCFHKIFSNCPIWKLIEDLKKDSIRSKEMGEYIINIIVRAVDHEQIEEAADERLKVGRV